MKGRITFWVTCVCLVCCIAFTAIHTHATLNQLTVSATDDLLRICRLSAEYLDNAAFSPSEDKEKIRKLAADMDVGMTVLDANGKVLADTRTSASATAFMDEEVKEAYEATDGIGIAYRRERDIPSMFAAVRLDNGGVVRVWHDSPTIWTVLSYVSGRTVLILALLIAGCVVLVQAIVAPSEQLVESVRSIMFAFAEGRFDERVALKPHYGSRAVEINEAARRIEETITRQNRRTRAMSAVLNQSQNGMLAVDDSMHITLVTATAKQLLGMKSNCDGIALDEATRDVDLESVFQEAMAQDGITTNEVTVHGGKPLRLYLSPLKQDDKRVGAVAMVEDISELRRMEQVRTDFAANVSHELKTPLTSIKGFVETLQEGALDNPPMAQRFLRIIMMEVDRLTRLINDILSITKMESGQTEVSNERVRIDQMMGDVAEMLSVHANEKGVTLTANESQEPLYVWGNPDRVEQLLINLMENAIKYNKPDGSVRASLYATNDTIQFLVSDTGIGIAEEHLPRLFERFYRVDKGRSRSMGGTGLGLAIVKHIAISMGGMIEVHSKLGEGTEFLVTLPRYHGSKETPKTEEEE